MLHVFSVVRVGLTEFWRSMLSEPPTFQRASMTQTEADRTPVWYNRNRRKGSAMGPTMTGLRPIFIPVYLIVHASCTWGLRSRSRYWPQTLFVRIWLGCIDERSFTKMGSCCCVFQVSKLDPSQFADRNTDCRWNSLKVVSSVRT